MNIIDIVADYGADPNYGTSTPAQRSDAAFQKAADENPGGQIYVPPGGFLFTNPVFFTKPVTLFGWPGSLFSFQSILYSDYNTPCLQFLGGAQGSIVRYLSVNATGQARTPGTAHGITIDTSMAVDNVRVTSYSGDGIHIKGDTPINADLCWLERIQIDFCGTNGLYVGGNDGNAGFFAGIGCNDNVSAGIRDESSLGNTYNGCHTRSNGNLATGDGGGYVIGRGASGVNSSRLYGCYTEADQPPSQLGDMCQWYGGTIGQGIIGGQVFLPGWASMRFQSGGDPNSIPLSAMGANGMLVPAFAVLGPDGHIRSSFSSEGTLGLGSRGGYPGQGIPSNPWIDAWISNNRSLLHVGLSQGGYQGPVMEMRAYANGPNFGNAGFTFSMVGSDFNGSNLHDTLSLNPDASITVGAGGANLPLLSDAQRVAMTPTPGKIVADINGDPWIYSTTKGWRKL